MALKAVHKEVTFGVGDVVRVFQNIVEGSKKRVQVFEGMVIAIRGREENKSFVVRRIGSAQVGIEKIFPIAASVLEKVEVVREGTSGVKRSKLYFTRDISKKQIEKIYQRKTKRERAGEVSKKKQVKKVVKTSPKKKTPKK